MCYLQTSENKQGMYCRDMLFYFLDYSKSPKPWFLDGFHLNAQPLIKYFGGVCFASEICHVLYGVVSGRS